MKRNCPAAFGMPEGYFDNPRMRERSQNIRVGRYVRIREYDGRTGYIGDWVRSELTGKIGVIVNAHPYGWDAVAKFKGTRRQGGMFGFDRSQIEVISLRSIIQARKAKERQEVAAMDKLLKATVKVERVFKDVRKQLLLFSRRMTEALKKNNINQSQFTLTQ